MKKCNNGRCKNAALLNRRSCERCALRARESMRRRLAKKRAAGICAHCPLPAADGKWRCQRHLEKASSAALKSHGYARTREYRPRLDKAVDEHDIAHVPRFTIQDRKLSALGRCPRCYLNLPHASCIPTTAEVALSRSGESGGEAA